MLLFSGFAIIPHIYIYLKISIIVIKGNSRLPVCEFLLMEISVKLMAIL